MPAKIGPSELQMVLVLLLLVAVPVAAIAFARSGKGLAELGKGPFSIHREKAPPAGSTGVTTPVSERDEEVRQMVEAANFRRRGRGEEELDTQAEIDRLLGVKTDDGRSEMDRAEKPAGQDQGVRQEIRQLVVANNERRERRGEPPLDVDTEVDRRLAEWT